MSLSLSLSLNLSHSLHSTEEVFRPYSNSYLFILKIAKYFRKQPFDLSSRPEKPELFATSRNFFYEGVLSALMDELGFDTLASPTNSPVIGPERSSQSFFVFSTEFGMIFKMGQMGPGIGQNWSLVVLCSQAPILSDPDPWLCDYLFRSPFWSYLLAVLRPALVAFFSCLG